MTVISCMNQDILVTRNINLLPCPDWLTIIQNFPIPNSFFNSLCLWFFFLFILFDFSIIIICIICFISFFCFIFGFKLIFIFNRLFYLYNLKNMALFIMQTISYQLKYTVCWKWECACHFDYCCNDFKACMLHLSFKVMTSCSGGLFDQGLWGPVHCLHLQHKRYT